MGKELRQIWDTGGTLTVSLPTQYNTRPHKRAKTLVHARHENGNHWFKRFEILNQRFRHRRLKHKIVFEAVAVVVQLSLKSNGPLFDIHYEH